MRMEQEQRKEEERRFQLQMFSMLYNANPDSLYPSQQNYDSSS